LQQYSDSGYKSSQQTVQARIIVSTTECHSKRIIEKIWQENEIKPSLWES
jgi:hypothetical protein